MYVCILVFFAMEVGSIVLPLQIWVGLFQGWLYFSQKESAIMEDLCVGTTWTHTQVL